MVKYKEFKEGNIWGRGLVIKRIVNQDEIVRYLSRNPFRTENQIMEDVYDFSRNDSYQSNKKYADCLRRALYSGKVARKKADVKYSKAKYYYYVPK